MKILKDLVACKDSEHNEQVARTCCNLIGLFYIICLYDCEFSRKV